MPKTFGSTQLCKFLEKNGFKVAKRSGTSHQKYLPNFKIPDGILRPFVIVVMGRKSYDPITANSIRKNLIKFGLSEELIDKELGN